MSTDETKRLDDAEQLVDLKAVEAVIVEKFGELKAVTEQANEEIKAQGEVNAETKGKMDEIAKQYDDLYERVQDIEQKRVDSIETSDAVNLGQELLQADGFKAMREGKQNSFRMEFKTAIVNATGQNQPLVPSDRMGGIFTTPDRNLRIRDILPTSATSSNLVEFTRENVFTNSAGPQGGGSSPEVFENTTKPESGITFTLVNEPVRTVAHWIPASTQVMDDSASLESHVNQRLMYGLKLEEENQLLNGDPGTTSGDLNGLITQGTTFVQSFSPLSTNEIDIIRDAIRQHQVGEYSPDFLVLNPVDWFDIEIRKVNAGTDDRYIVGNPSAGLMGPNIWGLPVVVTNSITAGTFLIGARRGCEIKDRMQATVQMSREDSTNFRDNMVTVLAEERIALCVYRTEAFITGTL